MQKDNVTLKGRFDSLRRVTTRTATTMVTFSVDKTPCKAFGKAAEAFLTLAPGDRIELRGFYETHSPKFGREFVPVRGRRLPNENNASVPSVPGEPRTTDNRESAQASVPSPSAPIEPIAAREPNTVETGLADREPSTPLSSIPPARSSRPADEFVRARDVTFEDLENQYRSQKAAREMEKLNGPGSKGIEAGQAA